MLIRILAALLLSLTAVACGGPVNCAAGEVPNNFLQGCVIPVQCDGGVANDRNECVYPQADTADGMGGATGDRGGPMSTSDGEHMDVAGAGSGTTAGGAGGNGGDTGSGARMDAGSSDGGRMASPGGSGGSGGSSGAGGVSGSGGSTSQPTGGQPVEAGHGGAGMPAPACGDGHLDPGEICDGNCPTRCDAGAACAPISLSGSAAACDAQCLPHMISQCSGGDGCCPNGCTHATDSDCAVRCGDGVIDATKKCDDGPGSQLPCPTSCDDGNPCTKDMLIGLAAQCSAECVHTPITAAVGGDGCCPDGANAQTDSDCPTRCGDGVVTGNETCDPQSSCPTSCKGSDACHPSTLKGAATTCDASCVTTTITAAVGGDGCCPDGANANTDSDCAAPAGCTKPSSANLVKNPGFATNLDGWNVAPGPGAISWVSGDSESCSISGSAQFAVTNAVSRRVEQCVSVAGGTTYYFAALMKSGGSGELGNCEVDLYNLTGCTGNFSTPVTVQWLNVQWGPMATNPLTTNNDVVSAKISCFVDAKTVSGAALELDSVYFGRDDRRF